MLNAQQQTQLDELLRDCDTPCEDAMYFRDDLDFTGVGIDCEDQLSIAGIDYNTDCATFLEMNGRDKFVTEV